MTGALAERSLTLPAPSDRSDLSTFLGHVTRLDAAAVVRLRRRAPDHVVAWCETGFDVLATRAVRGSLQPADVTVAADGLRALLAGAGSAPFDPGFAMDSAWRGPVPGERADGFVHVEDIPGPVLVALAERGVALAREHGGEHGPPTSLLDQTVLTARSADESVDIPMRMVFALNAMKFVPGEDSDDRVRVRLHRSWVRLDARYGSVVRARGASIPLMVTRGR
ncbi:hypothetical protein [Rhodococcoides kroppenstedtii]|uniref:hypothetical protein n=1 Tax=Rhodococcoides kroppenstedtii TaxID=293050 RepID=UPI001427AF37|nr:hypothetical protein [Rhodococcus kroppenstedtii]